MAEPHIATERDALPVAAAITRRQTEIRPLQEKVRVLTARTKQLELTIRIVISTKTLTEAQRTDLLSVLTGIRAGETIDPKSARGITRGEQVLIDRLRAMSSTRRRMFSLLAGELAEKR